MTEQSVQNNIILLLNEHSDQLIHYLPLHLHLLDTLLHCQTIGHWRCIQGTNTKLVMPLYRLLYNRRSSYLYKSLRSFVLVLWMQSHCPVVKPNSSIFHDIVITF